MARATSRGAKGGAGGAAFASARSSEIASSVGWDEARWGEVEFHVGEHQGDDTGELGPDRSSLGS